MPLVTLTCSKVFYPPNDLEAELSPQQQLAVYLAEAIPVTIANHAESLGLNPEDTPAEGVQVDIHQFHVRSQNSVDLWVKVEFAEGYAHAIQARDAFVKIIENFLDGIDVAVNWAVDMFWGPAHGKYSFTNGDTQSW